MMINTIKDKLFLCKIDILFYKGIKEGKITNFNTSFYNKMNDTYIDGVAVSTIIKNKPTSPPGRCYERSVYMLSCLDNATLVCGDHKDLEIRYGKEHAFHSWIEIGNYVYDPSLLKKIDKDLYYEMYNPTNISKYTKKDYVKTK